MEKLKPCPHCGGAAHCFENKVHKNWIEYLIGCKDSKCCGHGRQYAVYETKPAAIAAWNTRAEPQTKQPDECATFPTSSYNGQETVYLTGLVYSPHPETSRKFVADHAITPKRESSKLLEPITVPRAGVLKLHSEVDCRIEHGAESGGHLEYVRKELQAILYGIEDGKS